MRHRVRSGSVINHPSLTLDQTYILLSPFSRSRGIFALDSPSPERPAGLASSHVYILTSVFFSICVDVSVCWVACVVAQW